MKDEVINRAMERFKAAEEADSENRTEAIEDLEFRMGDQWPEDVKNDRELSQQACLTVNRIPAFVRQVVNEMRQMRPQIKVRGVDSQSDPETAEVMNGMIRAIEADSSADSAYDWAGEYAATCGIGYWRITTEYESDDSFDQCIKICRVRNPFAVYLDNNAEEQDGSDAKWGVVVENYTKEEFTARWSDAQMSASWDVGSAANSEWVSEDNIRVAEYWEIEEESSTLYQLFDGTIVDSLPEGISEKDEIPGPMGTIPVVVNKRDTVNRSVRQYLLTAAEILEEHDWPGRYIPIVRVVGEELVVDGKVERRGMVRDMRDPQRMYNYARSQYVDRISLAPKMPYIGAEGMFEDPNWNKINSANLPYVQYKPIHGQPPPQRQMGPDSSPGLVSEMQITAEELKSVSGIHDPGLGDRSNEVSGLAINARKLESDVSNFHYLDNLSKAIRYTGKILVDLIPKIYGSARMIRIVHADGEEESVGINQQFVDQKTGKPRMHNLNAGRYDVSVDVGPSYTTQRQEAVSSMLEIARAFPQAVSVMGDLIAKNMDWPEADEISKRLKLLLPPEVLGEEFPVIKQMQKQMADMQGQAQTMIQAMQHEIAQLQLALQNKDKEYAIKAADLAEKRRANDQKHTEGMTDLEIKAAKDLNPYGVAYG